MLSRVFFGPILGESHDFPLASVRLRLGVGWLLLQWIRGKLCQLARDQRVSVLQIPGMSCRNPEAVVARGVLNVV